MPPRLGAAHLRIRAPTQLRHASTSSPTFLRRNRARLISCVTALAAGVYLGNAASDFVSPPPLPDAGSEDDQILMADLNRRIDEDFKVRILRGKCLGVSRQLKGRPEGWVELVRKGSSAMLTTAGGAKGLGVERIFWNREEEKLVAVIWFGNAVAGWPQVTHGGIIATQMVEKVGIVAAMLKGEHQLMWRIPGTGQHAKMLLPAELEDPEQLTLNYVKSTPTKSFYILRVQPKTNSNTSPIGMREYDATLETMRGDPLVKATARISCNEAKATEPKIGLHNDRFKEWMWPSRQSLMEK